MKQNLLILYNLAVLEKVALETPVADVLMHHEIWIFKRVQVLKL